MASVSFQGRGRKQRIPYSFYAPLRVVDEKPLFKVLANDAVPQGLSGVNKDQQIGYWNEQVRWRMRRGERVELPSNWHFYYLGTGPHEDLPFRKRTQGVFWVALAGSKTEPTNLGTRKPNVKPLDPTFKSGLPNNVEVVEPTTPQNSRSNSRSQSRGPQSRNQSGSRGDSQTRNNNQKGRNQSNNRNQSRNQSRSNSNSRSQSNGGQLSMEDLIAAMKEAVKELGSNQNSNKQAAPQKQKNNKNTSKPKSRSNSNQRSPDQKSKPEWRRVPMGEENVEVCFGPRGGFKNFGDDDFVANGVNASGYAQVASLVPSAAALLFGGNVAVKELANDVEVTFTYKMTVPKDDPNLALFLPQVDAYKNGAAKPQRTKKQRRSKSPAPVVVQLTDSADEPIYDDVGVALDGNDGTQFEMVNEVFANQATGSTE